MEGWIMGDIRTSQFGGIPFGNSANRPTAVTGQPYFNGEEKRLELYTSAGWQSIVAETPGVASITGVYRESTSSGTIVIAGTNFASGAVASAIGTNGVSYDATTTTYNSVVQLTAVFDNLPIQYEPFDIKVTNPSNLFGLIPDALAVNNNPAWTTASGSLGTFAEQVSITLSALAATDETSITYAVASGSSLPGTLSLNSSTGVISGALPDVATNTTYSFNITASDGVNTPVSRSFSVTANAAPVWVTSAGSLGSYLNNTSVTLSALSATDTETVTYALASGSTLPGTLSLNSSTGVISGTLPTVASPTQYTFTINASDGLNTVGREFNITAAVPVPVDYLVVAGGGGAASSHGAGGGGAGGFRFGSSYSLTPGTAYTVTVSAGGAGGAGTASNGTSSVFAAITSAGGGLGSDPGIVPGSGGSGGGGRYDTNVAGGAGNTPSVSPSQGNNGGSGVRQSGNGQGGGGGGAGEAGSNAGGGTPGAGGAGASSSITGTSIIYAGGGGGSGESGQTTSGGSGGGGNSIGGNGGVNLGGGGGAGLNGAKGGNGGAGVVVIAYPNTYAAPSNISVGLTYDQPVRSGYRVYRFTAGTGTVTF
jgi:hypothetical protein